MREVPTDFIKDGCIAAVNVCSPSGNILLNKGVVITPAMGRRLRNWGITHVFVEGEDDSERSVVEERVPSAKIKNDLYDMFLGTLENPRMKRIFDAVCEHKLRKGGVV